MTEREKFELDKAQYTKEEYKFVRYGLECLIRRSLFKNWNGYVEIPKCMTVSQVDSINVHGGISAFITVNNFNMIGFDTHHRGDFVDYYIGDIMPGTFKDFGWMKAECQRIAKQIYIQTILIKKCLTKWKLAADKFSQIRKQSIIIYDCCIHQLKLRQRDQLNHV